MYGFEHMTVLVTDVSSRLAGRFAQTSLCFDPPLRIAAVHAIQNDRKEALDWLEKAVDAGAWFYYERMKMPWWDPLRNERGFKRLMTRMTTKIEEMRKKVGGGTE
ncbi:MAG: hypothetical protein ACE5IR_18810 [bacterium]